MISRFSEVDKIRINTILFSSTLEIGDTEILKPRAKALAILREISSYRGAEGNLKAFSAFERPIGELPVTEKLTMTTINESPFIHVKSIRIIAISVSGVFQVGSNKMIDSEARTKHIRQLLKGIRPI